MVQPVVQEMFATVHATGSSLLGCDESAGVAGCGAHSAQAWAATMRSAWRSSRPPCRPPCDVRKIKVCFLYVLLQQEREP
eukprot:scaffold22748_cov120-Isochrysis_galbana.AAC.5